MSITIRCKNGSTHKVAENTEYKLRDLCGEGGLAELNGQVGQATDILTRMAASLSVNLADFLLAAGKALDIECKWCELRNQVMRRVAELGVLRSMYLVGKTLLMRDFTDKEREAIKDLTTEQEKV